MEQAALNFELHSWNKFSYYFQYSVIAPHYAISSIPPLPRPSYVQIFPSTPYSQTPSASFPPAMSATKFHTHK